MRARGYTVHQSLSAHAAAVLKLALALARCRGHAQLTPLHVAFTLLRSSSSSSSSSPSDPPPFACSGDAPSSCCAYGLLRRACVRSHPAVSTCVAPAAATHPLQCRALELCFNVALNRLPTTNVTVDGGQLCSPASSCSAGPAAASSTSSLSASLVQPDPTLSNALVAALKRAQANQRRGCIELQSLQPQPALQAQQRGSQQQQPLLAIKVELDQLIISILDDPSVSRVMREAGFSSAAVKSSLEEDAMLPSLGHHICYSSSSSAACVSPVFSLVPQHMDFNTHASSGASWPAQFLHHPGTGSPCKEGDVTAILEVMMRKQGTRTNPVVVGDSVSVAEASVAEIMRRLETGDVPDELRGAHVLMLHLSYVHLRLMTRADVDAQVAELRRTANSITDATTAGLVIYVGDVRWAIDDDDAFAEYSTSEDNMVAELARLLTDLRAASRGRAWLVAAASYQTYMRCKQQRRRRVPSLEETWSLQPVVVPADAGTGLGLALGSRAPPASAPSIEAEGGKITKLGEIPMMDLASEEDNGVPVLCAQCADGYEKEASLVRAKAEGTTLDLTYFPGRPQANEPQTSHKAELMELRKWSSLCQRVHPHSHNDQASTASPLPWWCTSVNRDGDAQTELNPSSAGLRLSFGTPADHGRRESDGQGADTTLSLLLPDSVAATTCQDNCHRWSKGEVDGELAMQGLDATVDAVSIRRVWLDELLLSDDLKRKAGEGRLSGEPKHPRGNVSLDLNLCAADDNDDEDHGGDSEEEAAPSDLTNEGEVTAGSRDASTTSFTATSRARHGCHHRDGRAEVRARMSRRRWSTKSRFSLQFK